MIDNWSALFRKIKAALMRRGRSEHDADDLVQESWVRMARYQQHQAVDEPEAYLMKIALNLSTDMHRMRVSRGEEVLLEDVVLVDGSPTAEDALLARERTERLCVCLGRMSPKSREIFLAYRLEGMTYKEIARHHGLSVSTIEKHVARTMMQLVTWMEGW